MPPAFNHINQKGAKLLFPVFVFIFLVVYILGVNFSWLKSYNLMSKLTIKDKTPSGDVVLVVIDDKSLHDIDRWPWRRDYYVEIFDYFESFTKAKLVAYDGLIVAGDTENKKSDEFFFSKVKDFKKLTAGYAFSEEDFEYGVNFRELEGILKTKSDVKVIDKRTKKNLSGVFRSFTVLQKQYFKNINSLGHVNMPKDTDGYIRRAAQLISYKNNFYPSMALQLYSKLTEIKKYVLTDKYLWGFSDDYTLKIPIKNKEGIVSNYICYYKTPDSVYSHKKYSASDIITSYRALKEKGIPLVDPEVFEGKIVFVGANAQAQALQDIQRTPVSETFSGTDVQAINFDNLLNNTFYTKTSSVYNFFICALVFAVIFLLVLKLPIASALLASSVTAFSYFAFAYFMYSNRIAVDLFLPELLILIGMICAYSYRYLVEDDKKSKIQNAMGKYLSYDVMQNVVKNIDNITLGGKREDITVLFADIRNFTSISERMDPASTTMILNEYFSEMVPIIEGSRGVLNKFMGDAVLAIFGEPKKSENHALDAVTCGWRMLKKVKYLQNKWIEEGKPKIEIGIGISSGVAFVGNIGSANRLEYTVIGDTVNTASRIENYNKVYRTNFLISESTFERVSDYIDAIAIRDVVIRGKAGRINLYEVIKLNEKTEL